MAMQQEDVSGKITKPELKELSPRSDGSPRAVLSFSIMVPVPSKTPGENTLEYYDVAFWDDVARDMFARHVWWDGQYVRFSGNTRHTAYQKNDGTLGVNHEFISNSNLSYDYGIRAPGAPEVISRNNQGQNPHQQYPSQPQQGYQNQPPAYGNPNASYEQNPQQQYPPQPQQPHHPQQPQGGPLPYGRQVPGNFPPNKPNNPNDPNEPF